MDALWHAAQKKAVPGGFSVCIEFSDNRFKQLYIGSFRINVGEEDTVDRPGVHCVSRIDRPGVPISNCY